MRRGAAPVGAAVLALALGSLTAVRGDAATLPEGWRWEAYRDVRVAVPGAWGYADAGQVLGGCVRPLPSVGRPEGARGVPARLVTVGALRSSSSSGVRRSRAPCPDPVGGMWWRSEPYG